MPHISVLDQAVEIAADGVVLQGDLRLPADANGVVVFAHGTGSSRQSPRNRYVAAALNDAGQATLLMDLLTIDEEREDAYTREYRFDIGMLARRLIGAVDWLTAERVTSSLPVGTFGASTGAAAALMAAAERPPIVRAVVSRGGRPDLADDSLERVIAPTLLIVGGRDDVVVELNRVAMARLNCEKRLEIVPGATHLFEEPGTLESVARLAANWFAQRL